VQAKMDGLKSEATAFDIANLLSANREGGMRGLKQFLETMPIQEREEVFKYLKA